MTFSSFAGRRRVCGELDQQQLFRRQLRMWDLKLKLIALGLTAFEDKALALPLMATWRRVEITIDFFSSAVL